MKKEMVLIILALLVIVIIKPNYHGNVIRTIESKNEIKLQDPTQQNIQLSPGGLPTQPYSIEDMCSQIYINQQYSLPDGSLPSIDRRYVVFSRHSFFSIPFLGTRITVFNLGSDLKAGTNDDSFLTIPTTDNENIRPTVHRLQSNQYEVMWSSGGSTIAITNINSCTIPCTTFSTIVTSPSNIIDYDFNVDYLVYIRSAGGPFSGIIELIDRNSGSSTSIYSGNVVNVEMDNNNLIAFRTYNGGSLSNLNGEIWLYHIPTNMITQVTNTPSYESEPVLNPVASGFSFLSHSIQGLSSMFTQYIITDNPTGISLQNINFPFNLPSPHIFTTVDYFNGVMQVLYEEPSPHKVKLQRYSLSGPGANGPSIIYEVPQPAINYPHFSTDVSGSNIALRLLSSANPLSSYFLLGVSQC